MFLPANCIMNVFNDSFNLQKMIPPTIKSQLFIAVMMLVTAATLRAQDLRQQFDAYQQQVMQEKLYAHTDKNYYVAGEICWFKIYNVDAFFNKPLGISKLAYIELLDKNNKPVLQAKVPLKDGDGNGSLQLPVSLVSGKYLLRAYTRWMKNFSPAWFFEKPITVINTRKIYEGDSLPQKSRYDIQFFPEGGNMVNGLQSKIAFRIVDQWGKGIYSTGVIINEKMDTAARFTTFKFGMGNFLFTPQEGHTYKAVVTLPDGTTVLQSLPAAYSNGFVMQLDKTDKNQVKVAVRSADNTSNAAVYLFVHTRGAVKTVQAGALKNGYAEFFIDAGLPGDGISHFTVFNTGHQPVCERLFFKRPLKKLLISAASDLMEYETRKKVIVQVGSTSQDNKPLPADMSVAVYRVDSLAGLEDNDICSYLWLSSDLVGNIESPGYYFINQTAAADSALDNLMLTQGWRRFRWEDVLQNKKPVFEFAPEYKGHFIKGKVVNNANGQPVKDIESYLSAAGTRAEVRGTFSNDSGVVKFEMNDFYGNGEVIVQTAGKDNSSRHIEISSPFADKYSGNQLPAFSLQEKNAEELFGRHVSMQVQNMYTGSQLNHLLAPDIDTTPFYSKADNVYMLDDYVRFTTVEEILREYVPDVNVRKRNGKFFLPVFDNVRKDFFTVDPLILLDGVPVLDPDKIMSYDPLKIRKLEVVARLYYYGSMFFGGIINFVTYRGDLPGYELDPYATVIDYDMLQMKREFFSPVYETQGQTSSRLPDFRSLLYWSPTVTTDKEGKQQLVFYTSDLPGTFAAVLQGITADGHAGSKTIFFRVRENASLAGKK